MWLLGADVGRDVLPMTAHPNASSVWTKAR